MKMILYKFPVPIGGLILGLAALGNLLQSYGSHGWVIRNTLGGIAGTLFILFIFKLVIYPGKVKEALGSPVVAGVFPTFAMAMIIFSTYLKPFFPAFSFAIWILGGIIHFLLIIWFSAKYILKFNIRSVFPSWLVVYVGIGLLGVTGNVFVMEPVGKLAFWFGSAAYLILLYLILYRVIKIKEMPEPAKPTLVILAAPASLLLAGYLNSFSEINMAVFYFLMFLSIISYFAVLSLLPKLLGSRFYPSFASFTFPLIISAIAMKLAAEFLTNINQAIPFFEYLVYFQVLIAAMITFYVLFKYLQFLITDN